jgi:glycosyltransferase involved in cell wall biosynthesis
LEVPLIGFMGRLVEEKGLATLAGALNRIRHLPWRLALIGEGPYAADFAHHMDALRLQDRVIAPGYVPHPQAPDYLSAFDLLVIPSETRSNWREQFGRVIIEAMACGTPVVGSDSGEIPHLIRSTGGGHVFPEGDSTALAGCLHALLSDEKARGTLARRGRQTVLQEYTQTALARTFATTLSSIL